MAGEWKRVTVGDVCELIVDCVNKTAPVVEELTPYKMLRTTNIKGGRIDRGECRRVTKETFVKWTRRADVRRGDVILTREAPLGEVGYVDFDDTVFLGQRLMQYRANPALLEPRFLLYSFLSKDLQNQFGAHEGSGSTVSHIRVGDCSKFQLSLPPLAEQKAIAAVLGALDDKIELNRRMNATLEAMARALFQSWFVDFDPVRAKLDGRPPAALDPATAALFPASFQDSELGHIPKGWEVKSMSDLVDVVKGRSYRSEELADSKIALVTLKSFLRGGGYRADGLKPFTGEYKPNQKVSVGDLVVAFTDVTQAADVIGKPALVRSDERFDTLVASLDVGIVRPKSDRVSIPFLYCLFLSEAFQTHTYSHATGTTVLHLSPTAIPSFQCVIPSRELAAAFARSAEPLFRLIDENAKQSRTLATLRDTLLPKLLSGELQPNPIN